MEVLRLRKIYNITSDHLSNRLPQDHGSHYAHSWGTRFRKMLSMSGRENFSFLLGKTEPQWDSVNARLLDSQIDLSDLNPTELIRKFLRFSEVYVQCSSKNSEDSWVSTPTQYVNEWNFELFRFLLPFWLGCHLCSRCPVCSLQQKN